MLFSLPPDATNNNVALLEQTISRLRAEEATVSDPRAKARLLYEIGNAEEAAGEDSNAARDLLAAVNCCAEFREPLERLLSLIERKRSYKNLGKLLDRLLKVARTDGEQSRALLAAAAFHYDHEQDYDAAEAALSQLLTLAPSNVPALMMLEVVATKLNDRGLQIDALNARARAATLPAWRALLLLDLAELYRDQGDFDSAKKSAAAAIELESPITFHAIRVLERLCATSLDLPEQARALEAEAALIDRALADESVAADCGVPPSSCTAVGFGAAATLAAVLNLQCDEPARAARLLDQARAKLPADSLLNNLRITTAELLGDLGTSALLARQELDAGASAMVAASLWSRVAEAAIANGEAQAAIQALVQALAVEPGSIPSRARLADLLSAGEARRELAELYLENAKIAETSEARNRYRQLAAELCARHLGDKARARAVLAELDETESPGLRARTERLLAAATADSEWYFAATRDLARTTGIEESERASLWFESLRQHALKHEKPELVGALKGLSELREASFLAPLLAAFLASGGDEQSALGQVAAGINPWQALAELKGPVAARTQPPAAHISGGKPAGLGSEQSALRLAAAWYEQHENGTQGALLLLRAAHEEAPGDALIATYLAELLLQSGNLSDAAAVLTGLDGAEFTPTTRAALTLESALLRWQAGQRELASEQFEQLAETGPLENGHWLAWLSASAEPDDIAERRRLLNVLAHGPGSDIYELERFGLEVGSSGSAERAEAALDSLRRVAAGELAPVELLARALWAEERGSRDRLTALAELCKLGALPSRIAHASGYYEKLRRGADATEREHAARIWADADGSFASLSEWLGTAAESGDRDAEIQARARLAELLDEDSAPALRASSRLLAALLGERNSAPLAGDSTAVRLANLELSPPTSASAQRASALHSALPSLAPADQTLGETLLGWNHLARGAHAEASSCFRAVVTRDENSLAAWEGLKSVAEATHDRRLLAEACAALGDLVSRADEASALWEQVAALLLDELGDEERGALALARAVEKDIRRFSSFDRLFRLLRARGATAQLLALTETRIAVTDDPDELSKLYWEKARALRKTGDHDGALAALENVTLLEPEHLGALALSGEIYLSRGDFSEAAARLSQLSLLAEAPARQRLLSGVAAVDILENKLDDPKAALAALIQLCESGLATLPLRERCARLAAKNQSWQQAALMFEELMLERPEPDGRIEAARLAMAIYRDQLASPERAAASVEALLRDAPEDGEALDLVLSGVFDKELTQRLLKDGRTALVAQLQSNAEPLEAILRLATIAEALAEPGLKQVALGAALALQDRAQNGLNVAVSLGIQQQLASLDRRSASSPQMALTDAALRVLCDEQDSGPIPQLFLQLAPTLSTILGPGLEALGVTRKHRLRSPASVPACTEILAWAGALGLGELEIYQGGKEREALTALAGEPNLVILGDAVGAPLGPKLRQRTARELLALRRGTTALLRRGPSEIVAIIVAACSVGGVTLAGPHYAMQDEFARQLSRELPRKVKKQLPLLAQEVAEYGQAPAVWVQAAFSSLDRIAALATGDVSWVLADIAGSERGQLAGDSAFEERAARLLSFVFSPGFLELRKQMGIEVR